MTPWTRRIRKMISFAYANLRHDLTRGLFKFQISCAQNANYQSLTTICTQGAILNLRGEYTTCPNIKRLYHVCFLLNILYLISFTGNPTMYWENVGSGDFAKSVSQGILCKIQQIKTGIAKVWRRGHIYLCRKSQLSLKIFKPVSLIGDTALALNIIAKRNLRWR